MLFIWRIIFFMITICWITIIFLVMCLLIIIFLSHIHVLIRVRQLRTPAIEVIRLFTSTQSNNITKNNILIKVEHSRFLRYFHIHTILLYTLRRIVFVECVSAFLYYTCNKEQNFVNKKRDVKLEKKFLVHRYQRTNSVEI